MSSPAAHFIIHHSIARRCRTSPCLRRMTSRSPSRPSAGNELSNPEEPVSLQNDAVHGKKPGLLMGKSLTFRCCLLMGRPSRMLRS